MLGRRWVLSISWAFVGSSFFFYVRYFTEISQLLALDDNLGSYPIMKLVVVETSKKEVRI